jgi:hypothetical protein
VRFPAGKDEVAATAEHGTPQDIITQIRNADTELFESAEEVMQALRSGLDRG